MIKSIFSSIKELFCLFSNPCFLFYPLSNFLHFFVSFAVQSAFFSSYIHPFKLYKCSYQQANSSPPAHPPLPAPPHCCKLGSNLNPSQASPEPTSPLLIRASDPASPSLQPLSLRVSLLACWTGLLMDVWRWGDARAKWERGRGTRV